MEIINFKDAGLVTNLEAMPRGLGLRFLECVLSNDNPPHLTASQWKKDTPDGPGRFGQVVLDMDNKGGK